MRLRSLPGLLIVAAFLLFIVPTAVGFYTDWLWFREIGYEGVFLRSLNAQGLVFALTFGLVFLFLYFNLRFARRRTSERPPCGAGHGRRRQEISLEGQQIAGLAMPVSIIVAAPGWHCRRLELADVAQLLSRGAVRTDRSAVRARDRVLRLPAAGVSSRSSAGDARLGHRALRLPALLRALRQLRGRDATGSCRHGRGSDSSPRRGGTCRSSRQSSSG